MSKDEIGRMYLSHLFKQSKFRPAWSVYSTNYRLEHYEKAAKLCPTVLAADGTAWEDWIFQFRYAEQLSVRDGVLSPYFN